ncbi:hypothetical protein ACHAXH_004128 [Discostella pseudostelligera]
MAAAASPSSSNSAATPTNQELINLISLNNRASILFATDEWFATAENLLNDTPPTFVPDLFCEQGKVMDGWETRRRRTAGHDWCIIKLCSGSCNDNGHLLDDRTYMLSHIELDTAYFTGNQAPRVSIEAMRVIRPSTDVDDADDYLYNWMPGATTRLARGPEGKGVRGMGQSPTAIARALQACQSVARRLPSNNHNSNGEWITILPTTPLRPGYETSRYHTFEIMDEVKRQIELLGGVTHLKLNYYPDGGVARIKVFGHPCVHSRDEGSSAKTSGAADNAAGPTIHPHSLPHPPPSAQTTYPYIELSSELYGGLGLACSNKHYGVPSNLLRPYPGKDMGDGWETARHPNRPSIVVQDPITRLQDTHLKDWCVIKLGRGGAKDNEGIARIIVDTRHFKGNFPESVTIDGCCANSDNRVVSDDDVCKSAGIDDDSDNNGSIQWFPLVKRTHLTADAEHEFLRERGHIVNGQRGVTHVRISITPDGGISRVRLYGAPAREPVPMSHL